MFPDQTYCDHHSHQLKPELQSVLWPENPHCIVVPYHKEKKHNITQTRLYSLQQLRGQDSYINLNLKWILNFKQLFSISSIRYLVSEQQNRTVFRSDKHLAHTDFTKMIYGRSHKPDVDLGFARCTLSECHCGIFWNYSQVLTILIFGNSTQVDSTRQSQLIGVLPGISEIVFLGEDLEDLGIEQVLLLHVACHTQQVLDRR